MVDVHLLALLAEDQRSEKCRWLCLFMNKGNFGVRSPKSTFAVLWRSPIERPSFNGSWRVLFRCGWSAPICPGRSVKIRIDFLVFMNTGVGRVVCS